MSTLATYRAGVRAEGYDGQPDTTLNEIIQESRRKLWRKRRWSWALARSTALATTLGDSLVSTAAVTDLGRIEGLRYLSLDALTTYDMDWLDGQDFADQAADNSANQRGGPTHWTRRGTDIVLDPIPDAAYTLVLDYVRSCEPLVEDVEDTIPDDLTDLVVWGAVVSLAYRQREAWAMQYADQHYEGLIRSAVDNDQKQSVSESDQVKPYWRSNYRRVHW